MKFKIGDRVRVNVSNPKHSWLIPLQNQEGTILRTFSCANPDKGCYHVTGMEYVMSEDDIELVTPPFKIGDRAKIIGTKYDFKRDYIGTVHTVKGIEYTEKPRLRYVLTDPDTQFIFYDEELELVNTKPKFDYKDYVDGDYVINCKTYEEAKTYVRYMKWHNRRTMDADIWIRSSYGDRFCFNVNYGLYGTRAYYERGRYTILEFEDFDWSDFMKKEFTKADLKNGDVIKRRDGSVQIICIDVGTCICQTGNHYDRLSDLKDDLTHDDNRDGDIIAVRRPLKPMHCCFDAFDIDFGDLIYERKEVEEMTLEEVCKALGKEIKIVKK